MRLIDVDSHFLEPPDWLQTIDPELAAEIPPGDPAAALPDLIKARWNDWNGKYK